jgi:hypothetical protein
MKKKKKKEAQPADSNDDSPTTTAAPEAAEEDLRPAEVGSGAADGAMASDAATAAGTGLAAETAESMLPYDARAALWLAHLENEINRLRDKWGRVDAGLKQRESRIKHLEERIRAEQEAAQGRSKHFKDLGHRLEEYEDALEGMNQVLKSKDAAIASFEQDKMDLAARIMELERRNAEMLGRQKERESAYDQLQQALDERKLQLTRAEAMVDEKTRLAERIEADWRTLSEEHRELTTAFNAVEQRETELGRARDDALAQNEVLRAEVSSLQAQMQGLEADLRVKRNAVELLERSVHRINELGASLTSLDFEIGASTEREVETAVELSGAFEAPELLPVDLLLDDPDDSKPGPGSTRGAEGHGDDARAGHAAGGEGANGRDAKGHGSAGRSANGDTQSAQAALKGAKLIAIDGTGTHYPLSKTRMTIGRSRKNDIWIASHFVSRVHARIVAESLGTVIEDAGSKNGILVNSTPVTRRTLQNGDVVSLGGRFDLKFVEN